MKVRFQYIVVQKIRGNYTTILNYTPNYTLHPKLFECTFCTINYNPYYTLHYNVNFRVKLDRN